MFNPQFFQDDDTMGGMFPAGLMRGVTGQVTRRFDEYYRCYPVVMLPGPERETINHGGKVILPPSALDKLTRLHITYPMQFELINGSRGQMTHAGVLEFIAEEGKIYLPFWIMQTLELEPGDLVQIKSTELPDGQFIKLQAQSTSFLDISDPKAVLENAFRNFSCLTKGDKFTFSYNDQVYEMAVLETKPATTKSAISVLETDLEVDFAPPVGYEEPKKSSGVSTPATGGLPLGGTIHNTGTMAKEINYASIAPSSTTAVAGAKAVSSNFLLGGQKLNAKKGGNLTPKASTPVAGASTNTQTPPPVRRVNGPQPLRLPPGQLFFGYDIVPLRKKTGGEKEADNGVKPKFQGQGQTLRKGGKLPKDTASDDGAKEKSKGVQKKEPSGQRLGSKPR